MKREGRIGQMRWMGSLPLRRSFALLMGYFSGAAEGIRQDVVVGIGLLF